MRSVLALLAALILMPGLAAAQGFERNYEIRILECDQASRSVIEEGLTRLPGYANLRPVTCNGSRCIMEYVSSIAPNDLMRSMQGILDATGYRGRIGVDGNAFDLICLPGRRAHPLIPNQPVVTYETECGLLFNAAGEVLFDFDRADIRPEAVPILSGIVEQAAQIRPLELSITGHTDSRGSRAYNQGLSERRALTVAQWMVNTGRIPGIRVVAYGRGEDQPVAPNTYSNGADYPEGRQLNRRVEIMLQTKADCQPKY